MSYTRLVSGILFPLHELAKGHDTVRLRRALERSQWLPREEILRAQLERLRSFLARAARRVPYYRGLFREAGFEPRSLGSLEELSQVPFLTKDAIRENLDALRADGASGLHLYNTGGSTGAPLQFFIGKDRVSHDVAEKWRATRWFGVDIGDPEIVVWGSPIELGAQDRIRALRDRVLRTQLLPAFEMSEAKLDRFVEEIAKTRPRMLFGYPSALALIAEHAMSRGRDLSKLGIEVAFVTSEQLYEHQRGTIGEAFGCRVANGYGGRDFGFAAHECREGSLHITAEDIVLEIVDESGRSLGAGEKGEIVTTHLGTGDFPFIRYRTGDVGALSARSCPCGRGLPLLEAVDGRTTDFVVAADGTVMHALALIYAVRDVSGIRSFKIVQEDLTHTRVLYVPADSFTADAESSIRARLSERLGRGVEISMERVAEIPKSASGKHRYVESRVPLPSRS